MRVTQSAEVNICLLAVRSSYTCHDYGMVQFYWVQIMIAIVRNDSITMVLVNYKAYMPEWTYHLARNHLILTGANLGVSIDC